MGINLNFSTSFPAALDSYPALTNGLHNVIANHPNTLGDAIEAMQAKIGINNSAVTTSLDYILKKGRHTSTQPGGDTGSIAYVLDTTNAHTISDILLSLRSATTERFRVEAEGDIIVGAGGSGVLQLGTTDVDKRIIAEQAGSPDGEIRYNATTNQWEISNDGGAFNALSSSASAAPIGAAYLTNGPVAALTGEVDVTGVTALSIGGTWSFTAGLLVSSGTALAPSVAFASDTDTGIFGQAADNIGFAIAGAEMVRITDTGYLQLFGSGGFYSLTGRLYVLEGDATAPGITFANDPDTGVYGATDTLGFATGGTVRATLSASAATFSSVIVAPAGSAASPSYTFTGDTNTGWSAAVADILVGSTGGGTRLTLSSSSVLASVPFQAPDGTAGTPSVTFSSDTNNGLFLSAADTVGISAGGTAQLTLSTTAATFTSVVAAPPGTAGAPGYTFSGDLNTGWSASVADVMVGSTAGSARLTLSSSSVLASVPFMAPDGTAGAPSVAFSSDTNNGLFLSAADVVGVSAGGVAQLTLSTTAATFTNPIVAAAGTAGSPSYTFTGDTNTGWSAAVADIMVGSTGGSARLTISSSSILAASVIQAPAGAVGGPSLSFSGDPDTGYYSSAANVIGIVCNGAEVATWSADKYLRIASGGGVYTPGGVSYFGDGSAATPGISFANEPDCGVYIAAANTVGIATAGAVAATFTTSAVDITGDITAAGGFRSFLGPWLRTSPPTGSNQFMLLTETGYAHFVATRAGSITGLTVRINSALGAGDTFTVKARVNGSDVYTLTIGNGDGLTKKTQTQAKDTDAFAAGDEIDLVYDTAGSPVTTTLHSFLEIEC